MKSQFPDARVLAVLIFVFLTLSQIERGTFYGRHLDVPGPSALIQYVVLFCLMAGWLDRDSIEKRVGRVWDAGFFLWIAWPIIIPYYLIKTRGIKRASLILLLLAIIYFAAFEITAALCRARQ
jgi:hypothetical protein